MSTATRLTLEQYDQMIAEGRFEVIEGKRPRVELVEGELLTMSPIGPRHWLLVNLLAEWSFKNLPSQQQWVCVQNAIGLPELESAPEPDLAWVARKKYRRRRPTGAEVLLVIEVADSSLAYDCGRKAGLYASGGVSDYWVVNILDETLIVFREPVEGRYQSVQTLSGSAEARPLAYPEIALPVSLLFPDDDSDEDDVP